MKHISLFLFAVMVFMSCSDLNNKTTSNSEPTVSSDLNEEKQDVATGEVIDILLQSDDKMKFDLSEIKVKEGQTVKLTLKHIGTMPVSAMGHNFVLLKQGVDLTAFGNASAQSKAPDYDIPTELLNDVIAHTKMIGGGESVSIEFVAPAKGTYQFLCSFPGHYGMMKGLFIVE